MPIPEITPHVAQLAIEAWRFQAAGLPLPTAGARQTSKAGLNFLGVAFVREGQPAVAWELCDALWNPLAIQFCERPALPAGAG